MQMTALKCQSMTLVDGICQWHVLCLKEWSKKTFKYHFLHPLLSRHFPHFVIKVFCLC